MWITGSVIALVVAAMPVPRESDGRDRDVIVIRKLVDALRDPDPDIRLHLATALAKFGQPAVVPLTSALKDDLPERRAGAAYALALIGPQARSALPILLDALEDKDLDVRRQASYAISRLLPTRGSAIMSAPGGPSR